MIQSVYSPKAGRDTVTTIAMVDQLYDCNNVKQLGIVPAYLALQQKLSTTIKPLSQLLSTSCQSSQCPTSTFSIDGTISITNSSAIAITTTHSLLSDISINGSIIIFIPEISGTFTINGMSYVNGSIPGLTVQRHSSSGVQISNANCVSMSNLNIGALIDDNVTIVTTGDIDISGNNVTINSATGYFGGFAVYIAGILQSDANIMINNNSCSAGANPNNGIGVWIGGQNGGSIIATENIEINNNSGIATSSSAAVFIQDSGLGDSRFSNPIISKSVVSTQVSEPIISTSVGSISINNNSLTIDSDDDLFYGSSVIIGVKLASANSITISNNTSSANPGRIAAGIGVTIQSDISSGTTMTFENNAGVNSGIGVEFDFGSTCTTNTAVSSPTAAALIIDISSDITQAWDSSQIILQGGSTPTDLTFTNNNFNITIDSTTIATYADFISTSTASLMSSANQV